MCADLSQQDYLAICNEEGNDGGGGQDLLAPPIFYVSLANDGDSYSKKNEQLRLSNGSPVGQLVSKSF